MELTRDLEIELRNAIGTIQKLEVHRQGTVVPYLLTKIQMLPFRATISRQEVPKGEPDYPEILNLEAVDRIDIFYHTGKISTFS